MIMATINRKILEQVIAATSEPLVVVRVDRPEWTVVLTKPALKAITEESVLQQAVRDGLGEIAGGRLTV